MSSIVEIAAQVRRFIGEELLIGNPAPSLDDGTPLLEGLLDSSGLMQLVTYLEEEFGVEVDNADVTAQHFATAGDVARMVESKLDGRSGVADDTASPTG